MKKSFLVLVAFVFSIFCVNAQNFRITENSYQRTRISFETPALQVQDVKTEQGFFSQLSMDGYYSSQTVGAPQYPVFSSMLEIPLCESVVATVVNGDYVEYDAAQLGIQYPVMPAQPSYSKSYRGERTFAKNDAIYTTDAFYALPVVNVEMAGVMRDVNLANIVFSPVSYNPVTGKVRIYKQADVEISYVNADIPATYEMKAKYASPLFKVTEKFVMNPMPTTRDEFSASRIKYLIIAHAMFKNNDKLNEFVNWKKRIGYEVIVAYTDDPAVGNTTTSIKNYIKSYYTNANADNPAPSFLLFIGDHQQIPSFSSTNTNSHVSDLNYATWTSGDNIPDCYYGRFSAQTVAQLEPQITKTLMYESYTMPDPSYLGKAVLIAGTDANWSQTHADGQINYIYNNYINTNSSNHNYTTVYKHSYNCSSQAATIRGEVSAGAGWVNYTAHGDTDGWYDPAFSNSHVSSLNNEGKYGVMIGNCCLTGKFNISSDCFGEVLLRTPNKGAMAYIGASEVSYWYEDVYWAVGVRSSISANMSYDANNLGAYDHLFHTHGETMDKWVSSLGAFMYSGNMSVQASSSDKKQYYWEIYHIFGDASVRPYLGIPSTMTVSSQNGIVIGSTSYEVHAVPCAYVALTFENNLIAAGFTDANGDVTLNFPALSVPGDYELAVGAQNYIQYFKTVNVIAPEGPYVVASGVNAATDPIVGKNFKLDATLQNIGVANASNVTLTLTSSTPGVNIIQGSATCSSLDVNASSTLQDAFTVNLPLGAVDRDVAEFTLTINWGAGSSTKNFTVIMQAPVLEYNYTMKNQNGGDIFAAGDLVTININNKNVGHAALDYTSLKLTSLYTGAVVTTPAGEIQDLDPEQTSVATFQVKLGDAVENTSLIPLYYHYEVSGNFFMDTLMLLVGSSVETFETGDLSQYPWVTTGSYPWSVEHSDTYAGTYSLRSKQNLPNSSESMIKITLESYQDGNISYYRKVSSENAYDFFRFYIDDVQMEEQSGEVNWGLSSYPVSAGTHTYKFVYKKDYSAASGSDCAWIDNVSFPGFGHKVVEDVQSGAGIEDAEVENSMVNVYPNPANDKVMIQSHNAIESVQVYDISGRLIQQVDGNHNETVSVNVSALSEGLYLLKTRFENQTTTMTKFIKK